LVDDAVNALSSLVEDGNFSMMDFGLSIDEWVLTAGDLLPQCIGVGKLVAEVKAT